MEGELELIPNDGSGLFSKLTQERKKATTTPITGLDTLEDTREKTPRMIATANGIVRSADLNGDGYPDMITGVYAVLSKDGRYEDAADEKHTPQRYWNGPMPRDTIAYDYDNDGDVDLVVLTVEGSVVLLPNDGSGIFSRLTQELSLIHI